MLAHDTAGAQVALADALAHRREHWEGETTANNLRLIAQARAQRGEATDELMALVNALLA